MAQWQHHVRKWLTWGAIAGLSLLGTGKLVNHFLSDPEVVQAETEEGATLAAESVLALALVAPPDRQEPLTTLAQQPNHPEHHRARYLLAVDYIEQHRGGQAIPLLDSLAAEYPALAGHILLRKAQAKWATGDDPGAIALWQQVVAEHGQEAVAAEALYQLGQGDSQQLDTLLTQFPAHPRSVAVAMARYQADPDNAAALDWLRIIVRHGLYHPDILTFTDDLVSRFGSGLTPEEWQAVAFAYWENLRYGAAGDAYAQAPATARNLYRAGRGAQLAGEGQTAIARYQALITAFPDDPDTAEGMLRLAALLEPSAAQPILAQVVEKFPDRAPEAIAAQASDFDQLNSPDTAAQLRRQLLQAHSGSDAAADLRWRYSRNAAQAGDLTGAIAWAEELVAENPTSPAAAEAAYWAGKWHLRQGDTAAAQERFGWILRQVPDSYFAWRAAVALGWPVGDFQTVRNLRPEVRLPAQRQPLPAGSETLQELYQLGQDQDAWALWQVEFATRYDPQQPSVEAQFTDGVLRLGVGDNLEGMFMVSSLSRRRDPADKAAHGQVKTHPAYFQALYPFPFADLIGRWSAERNLNPLLVTALIRQESRFEPKIRSVVGATGLMQVMPDTADWIQGRTGIAIRNLEDPEDNINLGTWYLDYTHQEYDNHSLFAVASYNAGPGNVADWIARGNYTDADEFVDRIPFPETKDYIKTVFGGYWNYLRLYNPAIAQRLANHQASQQD